MDGHRFDAILRQVVTGRSRRAVLTALAGSLISTIGGHREVAAGKCDPGEHHCKGGVCQQCCRDRHCSDRPPGQRSCVANVCTCLGTGATCTSSPQCCFEVCCPSAFPGGEIRNICCNSGQSCSATGCN